MNEIATIDGKFIQFNSYELSVKTKSIMVALRDNNRNSLKIAGLLAHIHENNLFMDDYDSFETYAAQVFGLKKAQAYNLVTLGKVWVAHDEKGMPLAESVLPHRKEGDWQPTKLLELQRSGISPDVANELVNDGVISISMTVSALKKAVKEWKEFINNPEGLPEPDDANTDNGSDAEPNDANADDGNDAEPNDANADDGNDAEPKTDWTPVQRLMIDRSGLTLDDIHALVKDGTISFSMSLPELERTIKEWSCKKQFHSLVDRMSIEANDLIKLANDAGKIPNESYNAWVSALNHIRDGLQSFRVLYDGEINP